MYKINNKNHTCYKRPLSVDFHPLAIPQSASLLAQVVLGSSSGPGQGILVNTWTGELQTKKGKGRARRELDGGIAKVMWRTAAHDFPVVRRFPREPARPVVLCLALTL